MELCPLVCDYAVQACVQHCGFACARTGRSLLDAGTGRTRHSHLHAVVEEAARQGCEDFIVAYRIADPDVPRLLAKLGRKKLAKKLRFHELPVSNFVLTQADLLRVVAQQFSALLAKGFVYINGHALPLAFSQSDLTARRLVAASYVQQVFAGGQPGKKAVGVFHDLWTVFKQRSKKDASTTVLLAAQMSAPGGASADFVSADGFVTVYEPSNGLVLGMLPFDRASPEPAVVDPAHIASVHPRITSLSDKGSVTTRLTPSPNLFVGSAKLFEGLADNPDVGDVLAFCSDSLGKSVQLNGVYLHTTGTHLQLNTLKDVWALIRRDTKAASDVIEAEGNRSYWKALANNVLAYESVAPLLEKVNVRDSLLMKGCKVAESAVIERCVLDEAVVTGEIDMKDCYVGAGVDLSAVRRLEGPAIVLDKESADLFWVRSSHKTNWYIDKVDVGENLTRIQCTRRWAEEHLPGDSNAMPALPALTPDPEDDIEGFLDALFDLAEAREDAAGQEPQEVQAADAEAVEEEAKDMIMSTSAEQMSNLILELRSLRLSENVQESSIVAAVTAAIMEVALQPGANLRAIHEAAEKRGLVGLLEAFCQDENPELITAFYDEVAKHLLLATSGTTWKPDEAFVAMCSAFDDVLVNDEHLEEYVERKKGEYGFLKSALVRGYLDWLNASSESSSEE